MKTKYPLESSGKDFLLVRQEGCHTFVLQFADDAGSHALILVGCVIWVHRAYIYKEEK